jgi:hypothetical protein
MIHVISTENNKKKIVHLFYSVFAKLVVFQVIDLHNIVPDMPRFVQIFPQI